MFGFGKQKLYFGQATRLIAATLLRQDRIDYGNVESIAEVFDETEIEYINNELFLFRLTSLSFSFAIIGLEKKLSTSGADIGNIVAQGTKYALQDVGYLEEHIQFLGDKLTNDIGSIAKNLESASFDKNLYITSIALGFTDNFFKSLDYNTVDDLKRNSLFVCATSVVSMVIEIVKDFLKKVKIVDFK